MPRLPGTGVLEVRPPSSPVHGTVRLDGGKHAFAHALACAALADEGVLLNSPDTIDAQALRAGLALVFEQVEYAKETATLRWSRPRACPVVEVPPELAARSRSLFCLYPAFLARAREVRVAEPPKGCAIGARPTDWYIDILRSFGVEADESGHRLRMRWPKRRPADLVLGYPTMTGTVLAIAAAAACEGTSTITGPSVEPSCDDELDCLRAMGVRARREAGRIVVEGSARSGSVRWPVPHDRIHAVTYLTAGLITGGEVTVVGTGAMRIPRFVDFLRATGCSVLEGDDRLTAAPPAGGALRPVNLRTGSEPHFSSDWAPMAALLLALRSDGVSELVDDVFPDRLQFFDVLPPLGAAPVRQEKTLSAAGRPSVRAVVHGRAGSRLRAGTYPTLPDIRGSAAIALAALAADGTTHIVDDFPIRRGYADFAGDLRQLGLDVTRTEG